MKEEKEEKHDTNIFFLILCIPNQRRTLRTMEEEIQEMEIKKKSVR